MRRILRCGDCVRRQLEILTMGRFVVNLWWTGMPENKKCLSCYVKCTLPSTLLSFSQHTCLSEIYGSLGTMSLQSAAYVTYWKIIPASYKIHIAINCCYLDFHWEFCINRVCPQGSSSLCSAVRRPYGCTCTWFICVRNTGWTLGLPDNSMHTETNISMNCDAIYCYPFRVWYTVVLIVTVFRMCSHKLTNETSKLYPALQEIGECLKLNMKFTLSVNWGGDAQV